MTSYLISYLYPKNVDICQRQEIDVAILGRDRKVVTVKCSRTPTGISIHLASSSFCKNTKSLQSKAFWVDVV